MPTLFARSRPNLRGRLILRRLMDAAQEPTVIEPSRVRVDVAHESAATFAERIDSLQPEASDKE